ncbi:hypothetical protein FM111_01735 [Brevundimonas diminuta 3F5N]|uniref:Uncharacterized protein n=1 Tax=Brevundimonas diminuta 3F5N TaxID=1255603 RepID=A0A1R4F045_BREDI|nr:hypothetical protein FM111_01735 [Brevundimonas diminuta 3F5N]
MKESKGKPKKAKLKINASNPSVKNLVDKASAGSKQSK